MNRPYSCALLVALLLTPTLVAAQLRWTPANAGLEGGHVYSLHETPAGTILASTVRGFYRFDAAAERWDRVLTVPLGTGAWQVAADRDGQLYALELSTSFGLQRSSDDGRTWTQRLQGGSLSVITADEVAGLLIFGTGGARSSDAGASWTPTNAGRLQLLASTGGGRLAATRNASLLTSSDAGLTWTQRVAIPDDVTGLVALGNRLVFARRGSLLVMDFDGRFWETPIERPVHSVSRIGRNALIVSTIGDERKREPGGLHRSEDSGRTWSTIAPGGFQNVLGTSSGTIWAERSPGLTFSSDGGATWRDRNVGIEERNVEVIAEPDGSLYGVAPTIDLSQDNGVALADLFHSGDDAASWRRVLDSVRGRGSFFGGHAIAATRYHAPVGNENFGRDTIHVTTDRGVTWRRLGPGTVLSAASAGSAVAAISVFDEQYFYSPKLYVTTDGGATWSVRRDAPRHDRMALSPSGHIHVDARYSFGGPSALKVSTDLGVTWRTVLDSTYVHGIVAPIDDVIIAVVYEPADQTYHIKRTSDGGTTWTSTPLAGTSVGAIRYVKDWTVIPTHANGSSIVARSSDAGATWMSSPAVALAAGQRFPVIAPTGEIFAMHPDGTVRSTDYGATWQQIDTTHFSIAPTSNARVLVASHNFGGVYRTGALSGIELERRPLVGAPLVVSPMPATDRLVVDAERGTLTLVDLRGRVVRMLDVESGSATLDVAGLSPGVYVLRHVAGSVVRVGRVVIAGRY